LDLFTNLGEISFNGRLVINVESNQAGYVFSLLAALSTMIGWVIVALRKNLSQYIVAASLLVAAAAMILISTFELIPTANKVGLSTASIILWLVIGISVVLALRFLSIKLDTNGGALKRSAILVAAALTLHNFPEGSVAISTTLVDFQSGLLAALALSLHNIPEGLAIAVTAVTAGMSSRKVFALVAAATFAEVLGATVVLYESQALSEFLVAKLLTVVAGIMLAVSITELLPHGLRSIRYISREE